MTAYYNEIDSFCADWLRNLIAEGLIADGHVDTRSISDIVPNDLTGFTQCHFFAGIGGWSLALRRAAWPDHREVWTGSCPCQPFSLAGRQGGFADERHLWPHFRYHIEQCRPPIVFGEQVASASQWLGLVRGDLEAMDYAVGCLPIQAASAGADHLRDRYWFVAYANSIGSDEIHPDARGCADRSAPQQGAGLGGARHGVGLADANDPRSQGRSLLSECAGQWIVGQDGVADTYQLGAGEEREQRSREQCGAGCHPEPCDCGDVEHPAGFAQREPNHQGNALADGRQARPISGGAGDHFEWVIGADGKARRVKPGIRLLAHGIPNRVGLLRGFGNAIDPRPAAAFIEAVMESI